MARHHDAGGELRIDRPTFTLLVLLLLAPAAACTGNVLMDRLTGRDGGTPPDPPVVLPPPLEPGDPGAADVQLEVRSDQGVHAISPLIYGINDPTDLSGIRPGLVRLGGNRWTAWNWENNASNAGSDYFFQNDGLLSASNTPGQAISTVLDQTTAVGAHLLVTVPIVDHVAADKNGGGDVRDSGPDYLATRFKQNRPLKGAGLSATPNASDAYVNQDEFVAWLKTRSGSAGVLFSLDNEPDLWSETHEEVHPDPVGYDELVNRNLDYARAIKGVWPEAKVTGFVSYGFNGYVNLQSAPDGNGKGEFIDYYLAQVHQAEEAGGTRLIDHLDLHWYPEATGNGTRVTSASSDPQVVAARVQAPRSLWDESYQETSWIRDYLGEPIRLLPRLREKIAANHPGMTLAFTEWNYGGGGHVSGAVATADVLGIFGRDQVALAAFWPLNGNESFSYGAFRAYRSFDGAGGAFGDTSIHAVSDDVVTTSVYASLDADDTSRVVIVAINRSTSSKTAGLTVAHPTRFARARVYSVTSASAVPAQGASIDAVATNAFRVPLPGLSVTVLALEP